MAWYRWRRSSRTTQWHIASPDHGLALCGRVLPAGDFPHEVLTSGDPPVNEKVCQTCLQVSHRNVVSDL